MCPLLTKLKANFFVAISDKIHRHFMINSTALAKFSRVISGTGEFALSLSVIISQENMEEFCVFGFAYECRVGNPRESQMSLDACI